MKAKGMKKILTLFTLFFVINTVNAQKKIDFSGQFRNLVYYGNHVGKGTNGLEQETFSCNYRVYTHAGSLRMGYKMTVNPNSMRNYFYEGKTYTAGKIPALNKLKITSIKGVLEIWNNGLTPEEKKRNIEVFIYGYLDQAGSLGGNNIEITNKIPDSFSESTNIIFTPTQVIFDGLAVELAIEKLLAEEKKKETPDPNKHTYKSGECKMAGTAAKHYTCPLCSQQEKEDQKAKETEYKRVADIKAAKVEAERKAKEDEAKKIAMKKAEAERIAKEGVKKKEKEILNSKENTEIDKRFKLTSNTRNGKEGFDDANGEPLIYRDEYKWTLTGEGLTFPIGYGKVMFKDGSRDLIDYRGNRIFNDNSIVGIYNFDGYWFVLAYNDWAQSHSRSMPFTYVKLINIKTKETVQVSGGNIIGQYYKNFSNTFDSHAYNSIFHYNEKEEGARYYNHLWLSNMLGVGIKDWKALVRFEYDDGKEIRYYIDTNNKLKLSENATSDYEEANKIQRQYHYYPSW